MTDGNELLRRVAPGGKTKGLIPGSGAFKPELTSAALQPGGRNSHDKGGLSTKREAEHPRDAYWAYLKSAKSPGSRMAIGTWGFKVGEASGLELPVHDDAGIDDEHPENHATVWFPMPTDVSTQQLRTIHERIADDLLNFALGHGCLFEPDDPLADARSLETADT
jgi:hypothetical protein